MAPVKVTGNIKQKKNIHADPEKQQHLAGGFPHLSGFV